MDSKPEIETTEIKIEHEADPKQRKRRKVNYADRINTSMSGSSQPTTPLNPISSSAWIVMSDHFSMNGQHGAVVAAETEAQALGYLSNVLINNNNQKIKVEQIQDGQ